MVVGNSGNSQRFILPIHFFFFLCISLYYYYHFLFGIWLWCWFWMHVGSGPTGRLPSYYFRTADLNLSPFFSSSCSFSCPSSSFPPRPPPSLFCPSSPSVSSRAPILFSLIQRKRTISLFPLRAIRRELNAQWWQGMNRFYQYLIECCWSLIDIDGMITAVWLWTYWGIDLF